MKRIRINKVVFSSSVWHSQPDEGLAPRVRSWILTGKEREAYLIGVGDLFDLVIFGSDVYRQSNAVTEFIDYLNGYPFTYVCGNHDPMRFVKELNLPPNIYVCKRLDLQQGETMWHFEHGYQLAADWKILSRYSPQFTEFMIDHFPKLWLKFCKSKGWIASGIKTTEGEQRKYDEFIGTIHSAYVKFAEVNKTNCVIGHTHKAFKAISWAQTDERYLLDAGDLREGSYCVIQENKAFIKWLP